MAFHEQFHGNKKRKEAGTTAHYATSDYAIAKAEMTSQFQAVESLASSSASAPADLAKASACPPPSGQELAELLKARGISPPKKARLEALNDRMTSVAVEAAA